jgi:GNAT superfamily N-acetyltransferase
MFELIDRALALAAPLFDAFEHVRPTVYSILEGRQPGRVWADDSHSPRSVLMVSDYVYVAGDCENAPSIAELRDRLARELLSGRAYQLVWCAPSAWLPTLDALLAPYGAQQVTHSSFTLDVAAFYAAAGRARPLPAGLTLQPLDARTALEPGGMPELWGSVERFLAQGLGYCIMQGDTFVSSAETVFIGDGRAEIGVGTREPFRRQGFATIVCRATIEHCLRLGIAPEWSRFYNAASGALAASLGFVPRTDMLIHYIKVQADPA